MKKIKLIIFAFLFTGIVGINAFAQPSPVNTILLDPAYPVVGMPVTIYINANHYNLTTDNGHLSAWTGLITSASSDLSSNWLHNPISNWSDTTIVMNHVSDVNNDSVFELDIPDIATFYTNVGSETVFRIAFIARGQLNHAVHNQSSGGDFFEVFAATPTAAQQSTPVSLSENSRIALDFNIRAASDQGIATYVAANPGSTLYVHTGIHTNAGDWSHVITDWGVNKPANTLITVSDSIYRLYINPNARVYYNLAPTEGGSDNLDVIVRNAAGTKQTEPYYPAINGTPLVDVTSITDYVTYPAYPTVNTPVYIYLNGNHWGFHQGATLSAWTGLITSTSNDAFDDWKHNPISDWNNLSVKLTNINDSIRVFSVNNIGTFYSVGADAETVFRMAFIARDSANGQVRTGAPGGGNYQTQNIYQDIYKEIPTNVTSVQPSAPDAGKPVVITVDLKASQNNGGNSIKDYTDTVYAYSGVEVNNTAWQHVIANWGVNTSKGRLYKVNDSVSRYFIFPSVRSFYGVTDKEIVDTIDLVFRSISGSQQTEDIHIGLMDNTDTTTTPPVGINENPSSDIGISVFPNPVHDYLTFKFETPDNSTIEIYNVQGQKLYSESFNNLQSIVKVNVGEIYSESSVLIYRVSTSKGSVYGRFIKVK
jgi:hypothetical protein